MVGKQFSLIPMPIVLCEVNNFSLFLEYPLNSIIFFLREQ